MVARGCTIWFTGLSGSGKSTVADALVEALRARGSSKIEVLDGDVVRTNLSKGLGFSKEDRDTNILRIGFVCEMLTRNDVVAIAAAISPYREVRDTVRQKIGERFVEVFADAPLETCIERDVKGLYEKAIKGEIPNFTGVSDPYEPPLKAEVVLKTDRESLETSVAKVLRALELLGFVKEDSLELDPEEEESVRSQLEAAGRRLPKRQGASRPEGSS